MCDICETKKDKMAAERRENFIPLWRVVVYISSNKEKSDELSSLRRVDIKGQRRSHSALLPVQNRPFKKKTLERRRRKNLMIFQL